MGIKTTLKLMNKVTFFKKRGKQLTLTRGSEKGFPTEQRGF